MAKKNNDRQGYVLYKSWNPALLSMKDEELGKIFRAIVQYQEGLSVTSAPPFFEIIRYTFQQDEERYNRKCDDNRLNRMIGNLKGLKADVLQAQVDMIGSKDLQMIIEKAKDPDLKNTLILELHKRTQVTSVTNVTHVTSDTHETNKGKSRNIDMESESGSDSDIDMESDSEKEKDLDKESESGLGVGMEEGIGVQGEGEKPHLHGDYQNVSLTDAEWGSLIKEFGMNATDNAIYELSNRIHKARGKTEGYKAVRGYLESEVYT